MNINEAFGELRSIAADPRRRWFSVLKCLYEAKEEDVEILKGYIEQVLVPLFDVRTTRALSTPEHREFSLCNHLSLSSPNHLGELRRFPTQENIVRMSLCFVGHLTIEWPVFFSYLSQLEYLYVDSLGYWKESASFDILARDKPNLKSLVYHQSEGWEFFHQLTLSAPALEQLELLAWDNRLSWVSSRLLSQIKELVILRARPDFFTAFDPSDLKTLRKLTIKDSPRLSVADIEHVCSKTKLEQLDILDCNIEHAPTIRHKPDIINIKESR